MTKEELLKKKAELEAKIEAKKLEKEIAALEKESEGKVEVIAPTVEKMPAEMQKAAKEGDADKFSKLAAERAALDAMKTNFARDQKQKNQQVYFNKEVNAEVQKIFGAKKDEVLDLAKDMVPLLPTMDFAAQMLKKHISETKLFIKNFGNRSVQEVDMAIKALTVAGSGTGAEFVLTGWQDQVAMRLMDNNVCLANLPVIDCPNNPYRIPIYTAVPTTYYVTEGGTVSATDPTTSNKDFDCRKIANRVVYSGELEEDSIVPLLPFVERIMMESLANGIERVILFGDTVTTANTNINIIDGTPTTTTGAADVFLTRDGIIKEAFRTNGKTKDANSDIVAGFATTIQNMGVGAVNMNDLACFMNVQTLFKYMGNSSFLTWDKLGSNATLLKGAVGAIFGVPVLPSSGIPLTNSAGKIPSAGGTLGSFVVVKRSGILVGFRRRPQLVDNDILQAADQRAWVASARLDTKIIMPNAVDRAAVSYGYNVGL